MDIVVRPVKSLLEYESGGDGALSVKEDQVFVMFGEPEDGWAMGEIDGIRGWFPYEYIDEDWEPEEDASVSMNRMERQMEKYVQQEKLEKIRRSTIANPTPTATNSLKKSGTTAKAPSVGRLLRSGRKKDGERAGTTINQPSNTHNANPLSASVIVGPTSEVEAFPSNRRQTELYLNEYLKSRPLQEELPDSVMTDDIDVHRTKSSKSLLKKSLKGMSSPLRSTKEPSGIAAKLQKPRKKLFGVNLNDLSTTTKPIPQVVETCIDFLTQTSLDIDGLFRVSPNFVELTEQIEQFEETSAIPDATISIPIESDPHVITGCLKKFFRDLDEPLLTFDLYNEFVEMATKEEGIATEELKTIVKKLPMCNYTILNNLIEFLVKVSEHVESNQMTSRNLGIVFGPTLMRSRELDLSGSMASQEIVKLMIDHCGSLFD